MIHPLFGEELPPLVSVNENTFDRSSLAIYPNPSTDRISLKFSEKISGALMTITDISGKICLRENTFNGASHAVSGLSAGIYFVHLYSNDNILLGIRKLLVN
jgi:hypothetical protein